MRLVFAGLDRPLELEPGNCTTLEVENQALFVRLVRSLVSGEGRYASGMGMRSLSPGMLFS